MAETSTRTSITQVGTVIVPSATRTGRSSSSSTSSDFEKRMDVPYGEGERWVEVVPPMFFFRDPDGNGFLVVERN